jgi:RNA polymerase sigma-70 factor (ECF subfamily)
MAEAVFAESRPMTGPASIESVYREHSADLWRAVLAYSGDQHIASDAVSEAFAQALRRGEKIRQPERWVWKTAFKVAAGLLKERSRFAPQIDPSVDGHKPVMELRWALMELSPRQRASLFLFYYGGYPPGEIADMIGSTQSAVRVHLFRGRKRLGQLLSEVGDD